jgi:hypothetical protein
VKGEVWCDSEVYYELEEGVVDDPLPEVMPYVIKTLAFIERQRNR